MIPSCELCGDHRKGAIAIFFEQPQRIRGDIVFVKECEVVGVQAVE